MSELFDDLARIVGSGVPRRRMLKLMAVAFTGGALPVLRPAWAGAFEVCNQTFNAGNKGKTTSLDCDPSESADDLKNRCNPTYFELLTSLISINASRCPSTCPPFVDSYTEFGQCDDTSNLYCEVKNVVLRCHCNPPPGKTCCGIGVFCTPATQKCCGTYCGPINQPCTVVVSPR
ncbi:MAG: hypothetical protein ABW250_11940 [Pyrinomonadaceae bacterium]